MMEDLNIEYSISITDSSNTDFISLLKLLDKDLDDRYGALQKAYDKHNKVDFIKDVVLIYSGEVPVACGAFKEFDHTSVEIKRIFVREDHRKKGLAKLILRELEQRASVKGYAYAVLETGRKQFEAISLYGNNGYELIENYGPYAGNTNSVCMRKELIDSKES